MRAHTHSQKRDGVKREISHDPTQHGCTYAMQNTALLQPRNDDDNFENSFSGSKIYTTFHNECGFNDNDTRDTSKWSVWLWQTK